MFFRILSRYNLSLFFIVFLCFVLSCKRKSSSDESQLQFFAENGISWGFGKVLMEPSSEPLSFHIKSLKPDLSLGDTQNQFEFFVTSNRPELAGKKWDILYADKAYISTPSKTTAAPNSNQNQSNNVLSLSTDFIAIVFDYRVTLRQGSNDVIDIYLVLRKAGIALEARKEILIGSAKFEAKNPQALIQLQANVLISKIVEGFRPGNFILHITPNDKIASDAALKEKCKISSSVVGQVRNSSQSNCIWINPAEDVCDGSPVSDNCRPPSAMNISGYKMAEYSLSGAEKLDQNTFVLGVDENAEIIFTFDKNVTQIAEAEKLCEKDFLPLARTIGDRVNPVCSLQFMASSISPAQKLQCKLKVKFDKPVNYAERICNVYGVYLPLKQSSVVQLVLK